ncbi:AAA family ATPase [Nonomuraea sp. K274]|uniref:AAA family ATPase n=1 Tax=Nonomuraea cypriaca TaxID=1187855 RepID=A0A931EXH8_9ACTN|nr:AAA family ATPase [Nonomuraea cypriaca]MBF8186260.1 AAA family ATPase [Nonomuraea cypriaca]
MSQRIDHHNDPNAPALNGLVPSVDVVVTSDAGELSLIRRSDSCAPLGGAVDLGESISQAAIRVKDPISDQPRPTDRSSDSAAAEVIEQTLLKVSGSPANAEQNALLSSVVDAWRRQHRHGQSGPKPILTLVGGYAGSGKTEFSRFLSDITGWAFLDKDSMTRVMVECLLVSLGCDPHDRHTELYLREVRPLEYRCLMETAFDNLEVGTSAILSAPFIAELTDPSWVSHLADRCAARGIEVVVVWVRCDAESMREHIKLRGDARDAWKLQNWETYVSTLNIETSPPSAHITVDNRLGAAISLANQTREILKRILT